MSSGNRRAKVLFLHEQFWNPSKSPPSNISRRPAHHPALNERRAVSGDCPVKAVSGIRSKFLEETTVMLLRGLSEGSPEQEQEHRQVHRPVNRSAREPLSPGAGGEGVQQTRFFSYRMFPQALPGMTADPGLTGRQKPGWRDRRGLMLHIFSNVTLNLKNDKLYNTRRPISARQAVAGRRKAMTTSPGSRSSSPPPAESPCRWRGEGD